MDPCSDWSRPDPCGLPRTRGDGPVSPWSPPSSSAVPPHTRGWTRRDHGVRLVLAGSPAHAGMDPPHAAARTSGTRLPRTRGDGPAHVAQAKRKREAPPHTRGWTLHHLHEWQVERGSPAHAGMDRTSASASGSSARLPRTRGDGPPEARPDRERSEAPPHTRGWTRADTAMAAAYAAPPAAATSAAPSPSTATQPQPQPPQASSLSSASRAIVEPDRP